jgi:hypothetical protein
MHESYQSVERGAVAVAALQEGSEEAGFGIEGAGKAKENDLTGGPFGRRYAQTIVHLGVELQNVATKATLADALTLALQRMGLAVQKVGKESAREK